VRALWRAVAELCFLVREKSNRSQFGFERSSYFINLLKRAAILVVVAARA
jgi:hypothetical protein